jgi:O-antigen/teichoic acid export membrane protein
MSTAGRIAKNTFLLTFGELISKAALFLLTVLIARYLGSAELGQYSFAMSFTVLFYVIMDLGLNKLALRDLPRDKSKLGEYLYNILAIKIVLSVIAFVSIFLTINLTGQISEVKMLVYLAGAYIIISESISTLFRDVFVAFEHVEYEAVTTIIEKTIILALGYLALVWDYGLFWIFIAFLIGGIIRTILGMIIILYKFRPTFTINPKLFWPLIKRAFPFCLTYLLATLYIKVDMTMLSLMQGDEAVGLYSAAVNIIFSLVLIPEVFMRAVFPNMSRFYVTNKEAFIKSCQLSLKYLIIVSMPILAGGIMVAKPLILFIYKQKFLGSVLSFQILLLFLFLYTIKWALNIALYSANLEKKVVWSYVIGLIVNVGLNLIFIPQYSYIAASWNTVIAEVVVVAVIYYWFARQICRLSIARYLMRPLISSCAMILALWYLRDYSIFLTIPLGAIAYSGILLMIGGLSDEDFGLIKQVIGIKQKPMPNIVENS